MNGRISNFEQLERLVNEGESQILEFKPESEIDVKGSENRILCGVIALANTRGGNIIIGIKKEGSVHVIKGCKYDQDYVQNWISHLINSYVDPPDLSHKVSTIESEDKQKNCIGIFVQRTGTKYALRHFGRESGKPLSYHLLLRIGDSTQEVEFGTFFQTAFSNLLEGLSALPTQLKTQFSIPPEEKRRFDSGTVNWYIEEIRKDLDPSIKKKLVDELRNLLTDLPFDHVSSWTDEIRITTSSLLTYIADQIRTEQFREIGIDFLNIISNHCDGQTLTRIKTTFLQEIDSLYSNPSIKMSSHILSLLQRLRDYGTPFLEKLIMDAIYKWNRSDFDQFTNSIEFYRYDPNEKPRLRSQLVKIMSDSKKSGDTDRWERSERCYRLISVSS